MGAGIRDQFGVCYPGGTLLADPGPDGSEGPSPPRRGRLPDPSLTGLHLPQNPLLQVLVRHVLGQRVEAVRVLDRVAADDLPDAAPRLSGPVLAGERGRRPRRGRRDLAPALALTPACLPGPLPVGRGSL